MTDLIKQWLIYKDLLSLAKLESFNAIRPERVSRVLSSYAEARSSNLGTDGKLCLHTPRLLRSSTAMQALMSIWELARTESQNDDVQRFRWNAVMVNCNTIYNGSFASPKRPSYTHKVIVKAQEELMNAEAYNTQVLCGNLA